MIKPTQHIRRSMLSDNDYLESARSLTGSLGDVTECRKWIKSRQEAIHSKITPINFDQMDKWSFDREGNIVHQSGQFFSIRGMRVENSYDASTHWDQPVILQDEVGILGFLAKKIGGVLHLLVQAKIEPGNINLVQLSPTLQATRSNFMQVHGGKTPNYLSYFRRDDLLCSRFDQFQSEQGTRFLDKRNRNLIVEVDENHPVEAHPDYCWMTVGQIKSLCRLDNMVNMDSRSVLSGIDFFSNGLEKEGIWAEDAGTFGDRILHSMAPSAKPEHNNLEILGWITRSRFATQFQCQNLGLSEVKGWERSKSGICSGNHNFSVIATEVQIGNREVIAWTQPMMRQQDPELFGFLVQQRSGVLHFLAHLQPEAGLSTNGEIGPTVQCCPARTLVDESPSSREFLDLFLEATPDHIRIDCMQSEEGGRFYREQNRSMIVEIDPTRQFNHSDQFRWMTLRQLLDLGRHANYLNIQTRSLISLLDINSNRNDVMEEDA